MGSNKPEYFMMHDPRRLWCRWVVYHNYDRWDDPTYGNGGGEYVPATRVVGVFRKESDAIALHEFLIKKNKLSN